MPWRNARSVNALSLAVPIIGLATLVAGQLIGREEYRRNAEPIERAAEQIRFAMDAHGNLAPAAEVEVPVAQPAARTAEGGGYVIAFLTLATLAVRLGFPAISELGKNWEAVQREKLATDREKVNGAAKDRRIGELEGELARTRAECDEAHHDARHAARNARGRAADAFRLVQRGICPNSPEGKTVSCPYPPAPPSSDEIPVAPSEADMPTIPQGPTRT